jgi:hypothetical protein
MANKDNTKSDSPYDLSLVKRKKKSPNTSDSPYDLSLIKRKK